MTYLAAVIQITSTSDKSANLEKAERMIRLAAARGARLVGLPETFNWRGKLDEVDAHRRGDVRGQEQHGVSVRPLKAFDGAIDDGVVEGPLFHVEDKAA